MTVGKGLNPKEIASLLKQHDVIRSENGFLSSARVLGWSRRLKAGRYRFRGWITHFSVLNTIARGRVFSEKITFPEGIRTSKIAQLLQKQIGIDSATVMKLVGNPEFCRRLGVEVNSLEGYLYPDTYLLQTDDSAESVLSGMVYRFRGMFSDSLKEKAKNRGFTVHQIMTLASIVEGEARLDAERPIIAAIYLNRLRKNIPLQADPTLQYLIPNGPRRLLEIDLKINSPYNTYLYPGLPPGPVNNPGIHSIRAVLNPAPVSYLYLVANGDGSHTFSSSLDQHNNAKRRFDRIRQQVQTR